MATWNSRGLRGSELEEIVNLTNEKYREKKLALIQKIPTPIKPIQIDKATRHITLAYFDQRSTERRKNRVRPHIFQHKGQRTARL